MIFAPVIDALALPPDARVDQRVPKKLLLDQGVPTAADKRQIQDGIEEIHWIAALKPTNIGVPDYRDDVREYLEIAVLTVSFRQAAKPARLIELIHRAIPYPVVLLSGQSEKVSLSLAHKRWSQGEPELPQARDFDPDPGRRASRGSWLPPPALAMVATHSPAGERRARRCRDWPRARDQRPGDCPGRFAISRARP